MHDLSHAKKRKVRRSTFCEPHAAPCKTLGAAVGVNQTVLDANITAGQNGGGSFALTDSQFKSRSPSAAMLSEGVGYDAQVDGDVGMGR